MRHLNEFFGQNFFLNFFVAQHKNFRLKILHRHRKCRYLKTIFSWMASAFQILINLNDKFLDDLTSNLTSQLRCLLVTAFACEAGRVGLFLSWVIPKNFKMVCICCFSCFNARHLRVVQRMKNQTVGGWYVSERKITSILAL